MFRESFVQEIQRADQEGEQQRVLPQLRSNQDNWRKQCDEQKSNEAGEAARGLAKPLVKHPTKDCACKHRRQSQPEFRGAENAPVIEQDDQERRMGGSKAFFVGKGQRDLVRQAKVQGFVGIEEGSVGSPKTSE